MPKAVLEFNLPEEQDEYDWANNARKYVSILYDLDEYLRAQVKYNSDNLSDDALATYDEIRTKLHNIMDDENVGLY